MTKFSKLTTFGIVIAVLVVAGLSVWFFNPERNIKKLETAKDEKQQEIQKTQEKESGKIINILPAELRLADFQTPNISRCDPVVNQVVVISITQNTPTPRCVMVTTNQSLQFRNKTEETLKFQFAGSNNEIKPGQNATISNLIGSYLAPGVHRISMDYYGENSPEVWVRSMESLLEACAHAEIPLQGE
ncbi:hypothetical protein IID24_05825, partial [Patescibacteria group bacterium]|nr:hypothetical protein [Patescibacteria group bacterium]